MACNLNVYPIADLHINLFVMKKPRHPKVETTTCYLGNASTVRLAIYYGSFKCVSAMRRYVTFVTWLMTKFIEAKSVICVSCKQQGNLMLPVKSVFRYSK